MIILPDVELDTLQHRELPLVAGMAARGMRDNPINVAVYGPDPVKRVRALTPLYQWLLALLPGPLVVARRRGVPVGVAALAPPGHCFFRQTLDRQRTLRLGTVRARVAIPPIPRSLVLPLLQSGPGALSRLAAWGEVGFQHDPQEQHQHVELVVVEAALHGLGIGRRLMDQVCREMDRLPFPTHLETDTPENVRYYERFGFVVTAEASALGVRCWYMHRATGRP
jgi:ribosomal protein S18 acetylase RimI-like enzyme